jgi:hypothetical protein
VLLIEAPQPALLIAVPLLHEGTVVGSVQGATLKAPGLEQVYKAVEVIMMGKAGSIRIADGPWCGGV